MALDPHCSRVLAMMRTGGGAPSDLEGRRLGLSALARMAADPQSGAVTTEDRALATPDAVLALRIYRPLGAAEPGPAMVYLHGGGWVAGGLDTHDGVCRALAEAGGFVVLAVDYRLAPEHPFPAALDDAMNVLRWAYHAAADLGLDPARLVVSGDSAGANIAAAAAALATREGIPLAGQLLICPILDPARADGSRTLFAQGHFIDQAVFQSDLAAYLGATGDPADPRICALLAAYPASLPPAHIHVAEFDPFRDEGLAYAELLNRSGVSAGATLHPGMIHYFYALPRLIPYARAALAAMGRELAQAIG